jgi:type 1 glutamine amidotransferase
MSHGYSGRFGGGARWLAIALLCLGAALDLGRTSVCALAAGPVKVLLVGHEPDHPYQTHCYLPDCELLAKCLRQTPGVEATVSRGWPRRAEDLADVDCLVLHVAQGGDYLLHPRRREAALGLLRRGAGLCAIHWSTGASDNADGRLWQETLGGHFDLSFSGLNTTTADVRPALPEHPVCRGWAPFSLREEYYLRLRFQPAAQAVATANVDGVDTPLAWVYERAAPGGRSFGFLGGHFHDNFGLPAFRRLLVGGVLWSAGVEIPPAGAPCELGPGDLDLSLEFESVKGR